MVHDRTRTPQAMTLAASATTVPPRLELAAPDEWCGTIILARHCGLYRRKSVGADFVKFSDDFCMAFCGEKPNHSASPGTGQTMLCNAMLITASWLCKTR